MKAYPTALAALVVLAFTVPLAAQNLIANGQFETAAEGWSHPVDFAVTVAAGKDPKALGKASLHMPRSLKDVRVYTQQGIDPPAGAAWYKATARARSSGKNAFAELVLFGANGWGRRLSPIVQLTDEWQTIELYFPCKGENKPYTDTQHVLWLRLVGWVHSADVWFDDVTLQRLSREEEPKLSKNFRRDHAGGAAGILPAGDSPAKPGELIVRRPTLAALGFAWPIEGDYDRDAQVSVRFRAAGDTAWRDALPLHRLLWEHTNADKADGRDRISPNMFAGSIVNLQPATNYEVHLQLADPDGGSVERTAKVTTRATPASATNGKTLHVYPQSTPGAAAPAFIGLRDAYAAAHPGDTIMVHAGVYQLKPEDRADKDAAYLLRKHWPQDRPLTIRGADDGPAVFDGGGVETLFDMDTARCHILENITLRNAFWLINGRNIAGLTVRYCRLEVTSTGIRAYQQDTADLSITDNVFLNFGGSHTWRGFGAAKVKAGSYDKVLKTTALLIAGQGHDIAHNRVEGMWDGFNTSPGGTSVDPRLATSSIDFHHNDIFECGDDALELDGGHDNLRVHHNKVHFCGSGISSQPGHGGPAYIYRNLIFNIYRKPLKFHNWTSGLHVYHNTIITGEGFYLGSTWTNSRFINNLIFASAPRKERGILYAGASDPQHILLDYNAYGPTTTGFDWAWMAPSDNLVYREQKFPQLDALTAATGFERHGIANVSPTSLQHYVPPRLDGDADRPPLDIAPNADAPFIDKGMLLPTFNDNPADEAPDIGAMELGDAAWIVGPRPR